MSSAELQNLARIGKLKREPPSDEEISGLLRSAEARLNDAARTELSYSSRFDLAYNAAHALALVALRRAGYRSGNRYIVFQSLPQTAGMAAPKWRILAKSGETSPNTKATWNATIGFSQRSSRPRMSCAG